MFNEAKKCHDDSDLPSGLFPKITGLGIAIAAIWTNQKLEAISSLNDIANEIDQMKHMYQYDYPDITKRDVDKFQNEMKQEIGIGEEAKKGGLDKRVIKFLKEAESHYDKKAKSY